MDSSRIRGITNIGQWVTWNPETLTMDVKEGGTWHIEDGLFTEYVEKKYDDPGFLNAQGRLLTPGLIDPHTHPAFAGTRELEFEMRSQGKTYQEIAAAGGGIRSSVKKLREIPESALAELIQQRLDLMVQHGTTTIECKSGYGLSTDSEIKSLRAIKRASEHTPAHTLSTFLGAHEIPTEFRQNREW